MGTLHDDLQAFLHTEMTGWEILSQEIPSHMWGILPGDTTPQSDTRPMHTSLIPENSDVIDAIYKDQKVKV
jgi:hypothetical protein